MVVLIMGEAGKRERRGLTAVALIAAVFGMVLVASQVGTWGGVNDGELGAGGGAWLDPMTSTPVTLEERGRRGPDLGKAPHPAGDKHTTASPHAGGPMKTVQAIAQSTKDDTLEVAKAKIGAVLPKQGSEIWRTEQAMKKQLDDDTQSKGGNLWKQTMHIVDKNDPNAQVLSSFNSRQGSSSSSSQSTPTSMRHGPHHAKAGAEHRLRTKSMTMKQRLEKELNAKVQKTLGAMNGESMQQQQQQFAQKNGGHVADAARAHAKMKTDAMKNMLKSQLDTSVDQVVNRAKQLGGFSNSAQLEKRLKAELDQKAKEQQKKLLESQSAQSQGLESSRKKLSTKLTRAEAVREQLTKEMREENAIRHQLNMQANAQGKKMLQDAISGKKGVKKEAPHVFTKQEMEEQLKKKLDNKTTDALEPREREDGETMKEFGKLGKAQRANLEDYLRKKLIASDSRAQKSIYKQSVEKDLVNKNGGSVTDKNNAMTKAEMKLFTESMKNARSNENLSDSQKAHEKKEGAIIHTEKGLLDKVMQLSKTSGGAPSAVQKAVRPPGTKPSGQPAGPIKDMAHASGHDDDDGAVHDMAHASGRHVAEDDDEGARKQIAMGLGHSKDIMQADLVRRAQAKDRKKLVKFAAHEDEEAVE